MRSWKPQLASAVGAVAALVVTLAVLRGVDVLVMVLVLTALVGMYAAARAELIYGRRPERPTPPQSPRPESDETGHAAVPARWSEPTEDAASPARTSGPVGRQVTRGQGLHYQPGPTNGHAAGNRVPGRTHAQKAAGSGVIR